MDKMSHIESQIPLKKCPFCGSDALLYKLSATYFIQCENVSCNAEQAAYRSEDEAVRHWNRRIKNV